MTSHVSRFLEEGVGAVGHMTEHVVVVVDITDPCGHKERWRYVRVGPQEVKPHGRLPESAVHPAALPSAAL